MPNEVENVDLSKYPGLEKLHATLEREVLFPLENPDLAKQYGLQPKRGVLIHGSFGTGKTTCGRWLARRLRGKFFMIREMMVHADIVRVYEAARAAAPSIVFFDDADIILGGMKPMYGASDVFRFLLASMDGLTSRGVEGRGNVLTMLTAQDARFLAPMLLRSGRIELWLKTTPPDGKRKREIFRKYILEDAGALELLGSAGEAPMLENALAQCDGFTASDLRRIVNDAKVLAAQIREQDPKEEIDGAQVLEKAARAFREMQDTMTEAYKSSYI